MYIATRDMLCFNVRVKAGEPIPDPKRWSPVVLQSNINVGYVKEIPDPPKKRKLAPPPPGLPKKKKKPEADPNALKCGDCGKDFKTSRAIKVHQSRSH